MASQPLLSSEPPTISLAPEIVPSLSSASPSSQGSPSPNPVRSDPRFELLQKEFNSPHDLTHPTHQPNWELVGDLAESLLAEKGPDYLVALWLALARVKLGLWAGLYESLIHLNTLFKESWDKMEPPRSRLVGRQNLARWWEAQTTETLRAFLPLAKPLTRDYVNRLMDKLSILESALAKLEPTWEPCFWSLRGMVGEWPVQGETPPESFATFKSDGQTSSAIDNVIDLNDPPLSLQAPQGSRWPLLFGGILVGFLALFIVFFMYPLAEKTLEPEAASFRVPEIQEPASPLDHLINPLGQTILEPRPPKLFPCSPEPRYGQGRVLDWRAQPGDPRQLWLFLAYKGQLGAPIVRHELSGPRPVSAFDFGGHWTLKQPIRAPLSGPARSLAVGLHPGFFRLAVTYPNTPATKEVGTEIFCFNEREKELGTVIIRLTFNEASPIIWP